MEEVLENPSLASSAPEYLRDAIESYGTRTVVEEGEELERHIFFDDPANNGRNAIIGNTKELNKLVSHINMMAESQDANGEMLWLTGNTGTGKSELKRCTTNGLKAYSRTEEGRRDTLEFRTEKARRADVEGFGPDEEDKTSKKEGGDGYRWQQSPIQVDPLKMLPEEAERAFIEDLGRDPGRAGSLDPFSQHFYEEMLEDYSPEDEEGIIEYLSDTEEVRVGRFEMDVGQGIGILHSEDSNKSPKEKLLGYWMRGMLRKFESQGEADPRAYNYSGVISQGNRGITIIEDAFKHANTVDKLLNIPEEKYAKLDVNNTMDIDTVFLLISNYDLEAALDKSKESETADPNRPLRRRLKRHEFRYLTTYSQEANLLRRMVTGETDIWDQRTREEMDEKIREPVNIEAKSSTGEKVEKELAPHSIEAAAIYEVITRLDGGLELENEDKKVSGASFNLIDKAMLYDRGEIVQHSQIYSKEDFKNNSEGEGKSGIPAPYTAGRIRSILEESDINLSEMEEDSVILPQDVLDKMEEGLKEDPLFSENEVDKYSDMKDLAVRWVERKQNKDVLDAIMDEHQVEKDRVENYVKQVFAQVQDMNRICGEEVNPDPDFLEKFETQFLNKFSSGKYGTTKPNKDVLEFRENEIYREAVDLIKEKRDETDKTVGLEDVDVEEIPILEGLLGLNSWEDVKRIYEKFDPHEWETAKTGSDTREVKEEALKNLQELQDYSEESAEAVTEKVIDSLKEGDWDA